MKKLIEFVAKSLVDDVDAVHAHTYDRGDQTVIELEVAQPDLGKVIGR
ncbi:MAG: KH domain-containing protein, partial [Thermoanaerobaculia bacterium]